MSIKVLCVLKSIVPANTRKEGIIVNNKPINEISFNIDFISEIYINFIVLRKSYSKAKL